MKSDECTAKLLVSRTHVAKVDWSSQQNSQASTIYLVETHVGPFWAEHGRVQWPTKRI